ncbi:hypothetical protein EDB87DRAFT_1682636 [Lactarius vividus]|nr:hypothetical protein EDB87DRAFT_1682636 [Lactarius vividus]
MSSETTPTHGDSLSLAILIHVVRQQYDHVKKARLPVAVLSNILKAASEFDVQDTSLDLRPKFCALWNRFVLKARSDKMIAWYILRPIRGVYVALHQDTNSAPTRFSPSTNDLARILEEPSTYPLCNVRGHHRGPTPHIHDVSASTTFSRAPLYDSAALSPVPISRSTDAPSLSAPSVHVGQDLTYTPPLDSNISDPVPLQPAYQPTVDSRRTPATSLDLLTPRATQDGDDPATPFTWKLSASSRASTSTSLPSAITVLHTAHRPSPSDVPDIPSSPTAVLDNMLHTGSHSLMLTPATYCSSPQLIPAPVLGPATEGEGSTRVGSRKDKDALGPSAIRKNVMAVPGFSSQPPSPPSVSGVASTGPLRGSLNAEHTGGHPPHPLHGQYDFV